MMNWITPAQAIQIEPGEWVFLLEAVAHVNGSQFELAGDERVALRPRATVRKAIPLPGK